MSATPLTADDQDFVPKEFDVTFAPGETGPKSIEIDVLDDDSLENTEAFQVSFISSSVPAVKLGKPSSVNIMDNDGIIYLSVLDCPCFGIKLFYSFITSFVFHQSSVINHQSSFKISS